MELKEFLSKKFKMKDLGFLNYFLGLEITSNTIGYYLFQAKYAIKLLSWALLIDSKIAPILIKSNINFTPTDSLIS